MGIRKRDDLLISLFVYINRVLIFINVNIPYKTKECIINSIDFV